MTSTSIFPGFVSRFVLAFIPAAMALTLIGCATSSSEQACVPGDPGQDECSAVAGPSDPFIDQLYDKRTWRPARDLDFDPVTVATEFDIPIQQAKARFIGSDENEGVYSLAAKIWLIENARHTIDVTYYIFKHDLIGQAMLGALCDAVQRGVDVRFMVDSVGSLNVGHASLKALETCADEAGYIRNAQGEPTDRKARVQVVIFNAISKVFVRLNRRSHDKLLVIDGSFPDRAVVMTGGRNVSLSYYGITADGSPNPDTYMDAEIILRPVAEDIDPQKSLGSLSEAYYSMIFLFGDNKLLQHSAVADSLVMYQDELTEAREALVELKALPIVADAYAAMPSDMNEGWNQAEVLLTHEMDNLTNRSIFERAHEQEEANKNSIIRRFHQVRRDEYLQRRIVSPYLFVAQYSDEEGNIVFDGAKNALDWLEQHPGASIEVITNSVLTSDNFPAQAVIDMDMAPRLLLNESVRERWLEGYEESELNMELVSSDEWRELVSHPRLKIYETGRLDDRLLGGDVDYGKLHAKYIIADDVGFVGTTNFDYRSRLINNEMGFFFRGEELAAKLNADFELLKSRSYLWGSPQWLELRRRVGELDDIRGTTLRNQRAIYKSLRAVGLDNLL